MIKNYLIEQEITRVCKIMDKTKLTVEILQALAETTIIINNLYKDYLEATIYIKYRNYITKMFKIYLALMETVEYKASDKQVAILFKYNKSFNTKSLKAYCRLQKMRMTDITPRMEDILSFVEPY